MTWSFSFSSTLVPVTRRTVTSHSSPAGYSWERAAQRPGIMATVRSVPSSSLRFSAEAARSGIWLPAELSSCEETLLNSPIRQLRGPDALSWRRRLCFGAGSGRRCLGWLRHQAAPCRNCVYVQTAKVGVVKASPL